tara:strand:- start:12477 stop:13256 length:780 start_codon:yes stop_codon:yes gene_type:complete
MEYKIECLARRSFNAKCKKISNAQILALINYMKKNDLDDLDETKSHLQNIDLDFNENDWSLSKFFYSDRNNECNFKDYQIHFWISEAYGDDDGIDPIGKRVLHFGIDEIHRTSHKITHDLTPDGYPSDLPDGSKQYLFELNHCEDKIFTTYIESSTQPTLNDFSFTSGGILTPGIDNMTIFDVFDSGGGIYELPYVDEIKFKDKVLDFDIYLYNYIQENLCIIMGEPHEREIKGHTPSTVCQKYSISDEDFDNFLERMK